MVTREFPQSSRSTVGVTSDFPGSSGDRERGKFRPSATPRLTVVAVTNDDGSVIADGLATVLNELLLHQRAMVLGLSMLLDTDLLEEVR